MKELENEQHLSKTQTQRTPVIKAHVMHLNNNQLCIFFYYYYKQTE